MSSELADSPELAHNVVLAVDATGVGRAVVDLLRAALKPLGTPLVAITITGGSAASRRGSKRSVPKKNRLSRPARNAAKAPEDRQPFSTAQVLVDELVSYRVKISEDGHDSYSNGRDAPNDDLVLSASLAVFVASKRTTMMAHAGPWWLDAEDDAVDATHRTPAPAPTLEVLLP